MAVIHRAELTARIIDSARRGIAVITAPAGYGKTQAAQDALPNGILVALRPQDADPHQLGARIVSAVLPSLTAAYAAIAHRADADQTRQWLSSRLRDFASPIIIDDLHVLSESPASIQFLKDLVDASNGDLLQWALLSRQELNIPIGTWLARDRMSMPIGPDELVFSPADIEAVALATNIEASAEQIQWVMAETRGWPLAVRLIYGAWGHASSHGRIQLHTRSALFAYFDEVVWAALTESQRRIIEIATYVRELHIEMLPPEVEATDLVRLEWRIPLLTRSGNAYKLHDLFQEFVRERADRDRTDTQPRLVSLVKRLVASNRDIDALEVALQIPLWDEVLAALERIGVAQVESANRQRIAAVIETLPRALQNNQIAVGLRGLIRALSGDGLVAQRDLIRALQAPVAPDFRARLALHAAAYLLNAGESPDALSLLGKTLLFPGISPSNVVELKAAIAQNAAIVDDFALADDAISYCITNLDICEPFARCTVLGRLGLAYFYLRNVPLSYKLTLEAAQLAELGNFSYVAGACYSLLSNIALRDQHDYKSARRWAHLLTNAGEQCGDRQFQINGLQSEYILAVDRGDVEHCGQLQQRLRDIDHHANLRYSISMKIAAATLEIIKDNHVSAITTLQSGASPANSVEKEEVDAFLFVILSSRRSDEAYRYADEGAVKEKLNVEQRNGIGRARMWRAFGHWLASPVRVARRAKKPTDPFLNARDQRISQVLNYLMMLPRGAITNQKAVELTQPLVAFDLPGIAIFLQSLLRLKDSQGLSRSELAVLREYAIGGTAISVAERLQKSPFTVRNQMKSIIKKFDCSSMSEAISHARESGMV